MGRLQTLTNKSNLEINKITATLYHPGMQGELSMLNLFYTSNCIGPMCRIVFAEIWDDIGHDLRVN